MVFHAPLFWSPTHSLGPFSFMKMDSLSSSSSYQLIHSEYSPCHILLQGLCMCQLIQHSKPYMDSSNLRTHPVRIAITSLLQVRNRGTERHANLLESTRQAGGRGGIQTQAAGSRAAYILPVTPVILDLPISEL